MKVSSIFWMMATTTTMQYHHAFATTAVKDHGVATTTENQMDRATTGRLRSVDSIGTTWRYAPMTWSLWDTETEPIEVAETKAADVDLLMIEEQDQFEKVFGEFVEVKNLFVNMGMFSMDTHAPSVSAYPSMMPSSSIKPTDTVPSATPSHAPSAEPSDVPSGPPSVSTFPSAMTESPSASPMVEASNLPSAEPSVSPSTPQPEPSSGPSRIIPSVAPTTPQPEPSSGPSRIIPSLAPTPNPTPLPTIVSSAAPSIQDPSSVPSEIPSVAPTPSPTPRPSRMASAFPSMLPTRLPSGMPSGSPTVVASASPSLAPTLNPTPRPTTLAPTPFPTTDPPSRAPSVSQAPTTTKCGLSPQQRSDMILMVLDDVADPVAIRDSTTDQGMATDWIIGNDALLVCPDDEKFLQRWALAVMYFAAEGPNWTTCFEGDGTCGSVLPFNLGGVDAFLSASSECDWAGISCVNGCVTVIEFESNGLGGTIATEIGLLTNLSRWGMEQGTMTSTIPTEAGDLTNLVFIDLDFNRLTGTIPTEIQRLSNLGTLDLNDNRLTGDIEGLGMLQSLTFLQVNGNDGIMGTVPSEIGSISNLSVFNLHGTSMTGVMPQEVCDLTSGSLSSLIADCLGPGEEIVCDCCDCR